MSKVIQEEDWNAYKEKVGTDTGRRLDRIQGEGWIGYREKVEWI